MATAQEQSSSIEAVIADLAPERDGSSEKTYLLLQLSPEVDRTIEELMVRTHLPKADVLNMAVGFLKAAADAIAEGKHVGIASDEQNLEVEFTGL
jgi:hypothetical protein